MKKFAKQLCSLVIGLCLLGAVASAPADAAFGITAFDGQVTADEAGSAFTQASGHPYEVETWFDFATNGLSPGGHPLPDGNVKDLAVEAPAGLLGNPTVVGHCSEGDLEVGACPPDAQLGFLTFTTSSDAFPIEGAAIYNMVPRDGNVAEFGSDVLGNSIVHIVPIVRTDGDYGLRLESKNTSQGLAMTKLKIALWGDPANPVHDPLRLQGNGVVFCGDLGFGMFCAAGGASSSLPDKPFLTNPGDCAAGPLTTTAFGNSWQDPGTMVERKFISHLPPAYPLAPSEWGPPTGVTGCDKVKFEPSFEAKPSETTAASPTGLSVDLSFGQDGLEEKEGLAASPLKDAKVTLPAGMAINPSAASGLQACGDAQLGLGTRNPASCPEASKIGTVEAVSPLLQKYDENGETVLGPGGVPILDTLKGGVYIRSQGSNDPESGQMFRLALVLENAARGLVVKLPGEVRVNPNSGQIVTTFKNNPQLPVSEVKFDLNAGPRAALVTPTECGSKTIAAELTSWSGQSANLTSSFDVKGCGGGGFAPKFEAGTENPVAAKYSPFNLRLTRNADEAAFTAIDVTEPKGLTAALKGVPYCPESALASVSSRSGSSVLGDPGCPSASQVGQVTVGAGAGPLPYYLETGKVFLAGPYKGAPLSLAIVTPAVAGPFDLGTVLTRAAVFVDRESAQISVKSDPIPTILGGVPLDLRDLRVAVNRPQFVLNPTNCTASSVGGSVSSSAGGAANVSSRFQVADCASLPFGPTLTLKITGKHGRGAYQKLRAELKAAPGEANIGRVSVALPHSEFLAQNHIKTVCTRVQYAANQCPAASIYGYARAWTPLLDQPLEGPVYLRSSSHKLPDLVASLDGQIHIDLDGRIDSFKGGIRNTFEAVPDAPVSKFVLAMNGGRKSLLVNSTNVCRAPNLATVKMVGQNGKAFESSPALKTTCGRGKSMRKKAGK